MWNGRWSRELDSLYQLYEELFGQEPDCELEETAGVDFDTLSYQEFKKKLLRSVTLRQRIK